MNRLPNLVVLHILCLSSHAMQASSDPAPEIPFTRHVLPNGLTVILHPDHRLPAVCVNLWYFVGSKDEPPGRSGFAHLFEHLMFMGTEKVPYPSFDTIMEAAGGSNNASTSEDRTNYFASGHRGLLETFIYLEADRMASLGPSMTQEKLDTQRDVVRNERRQSYENRPYGKAYLEIPPTIYPPGHPYHNPVIGSHADLERATLEDVKEFFRRFYYPGNASLVIAGDFDPAEARRLVDKHFGPLDASPPPASGNDGRAAFPPAPRIEGSPRVTLEDNVELPLSILVWHSPAVYADGDADMDILASLLGGGKSSRLYRSLVHDRQLAQEVNVSQSSAYLVSEFHVRVHARPGVSQEAIEAEVDREIGRIQAEGPSEHEVQRAKNRIETAFWRGMEGLLERADRLNGYNFHLGDPGAIARDRARYDAVTRETVKARANAVLKKDARLVLRVVPKRLLE
ncbi:MAG TPA: pitrilysin family protein [Planctomycetota bacterium]|nr:pitrilysin family protein [Planctomycetota bacterium]